MSKKNKLHNLKVLSGIFILVVIIIGASLYTGSLYNNSSNQLEELISNMEISIKSGDWKKTDSEMKKISKRWHQIEGTWATLLDHFEIDNIEISLLRLSKYIESQDSSLTLSEAAALKQYIRHIPEKESLDWKNIF